MCVLHSKGLRGLFQVDECRHDRVRVGRWRIEKCPSSPSRFKVKYFGGHFGGHLGLWWPDCNTNFRNGSAALDNPFKLVLDDSLVHLD